MRPRAAIGRVAAAIEDVARAGEAPPGYEVDEAARAVVFGLLAARWLGQPAWTPGPWWSALRAALPPSPAALDAVASVPLLGFDPLTPLHAGWLARHARARRQQTGTWYTPPAVVAAVLALIDDPGPAPRVLDPAVGTGEFLLAAAARWPAAHLTGVDRDAAALVVAAARLARAGHAATLERADSLATPRPAPVDVIVGNPPWWRAPAAAEAGGFLRAGHPDVGDGQPLFDDLRVPGANIQNIYNYYVYFWRLCCWLAFERGAAPATVALLTPSSFLRGPGFGGLRALLRRLADDVRVLDLGGDGRSGVDTANVLAVRTPACITVAARGGAGAGVQVATLPPGDLAARLARLADPDLPRALTWRPAPAGPFVGESPAPWRAWPTLSQVLPWRRSGVKVGRTWPIAADPAVLRDRWAALLAAPHGARAPLFKDSPTGRRAARPVGALTPVDALPASAPCPPILPYAWRTFDRRWLLDDPRLHDRGAEPLRAAHSPSQRYLTTGHGGPTGPWATICAEVPDLHHFSGRGARDVLPRWRDAAGRIPNGAAPPGVDPAEAFFVVAAILGQPGAGARLGDQAGEPRLPLPRDAGLWAEGVALGAHLVAVEAEDVEAAPLPHGPPRRRAGHLWLGDAPVLALADPAWRFRAGGLAVLPRLVAGREGAGRWSSPLDALGVGWSARDTRDLAQALARVRAVLALAAPLAAWLDRVLASDDLWRAAEWPAATDVLR